MTVIWDVASCIPVETAHDSEVLTASISRVMMKTLAVSTSENSVSF
jgi:hypothetical protein